ncbi:hypothetical protein [Novosphingobium mathurense]|uniref:hypothetical protein n=1 Tax=Novosphingobium mathurense TaxID=428990 RepID=UPI001115BD70|nr:hypothetical protein [Novosphingobium mathurense]
MPIYEVRRRNSQFSSEITHEFEATDANEALLIAQDRARLRVVELWEDGEVLCKLERESVGELEIWTIRRPRWEDR